MNEKRQDASEKISNQGRADNASVFRDRRPPKRTRRNQRTKPFPWKNIALLLGAIATLIGALDHFTSNILGQAIEVYRIKRSYEQSDEVLSPSATLSSIPVQPTNSNTPKPRQIVSFSDDVSFQGGWRKTRGDNDMDTDGDDLVTARSTTELKYDSNRVWIVVSFSCAEDGGDRTAFSGTQERVLAQVRDGQQIVGLNYVGSTNIKSFRYSSRGRTHFWHPFPPEQVGNTYWSKFGYIIDTPSKNDSKYVGVMGKISFQYLVE